MLNCFIKVMNPILKEAINLYKKGELGKAQKICLEFVKSEPNNFDFLHLLGIISFQNKNYKAADELFKKAINIKPNFADTYINRGILLKKQNKLDDALECWNIALKLNPKLFQAYNHCGIALIELNRPEEAIENWNNAIKIKPDFAEAYNNLGNAFYELKKFDESLKNYDKAINIKPNFAEAYNNRASALRHLNQFNSALDSCNAALEINTNFAEAYINRGIIFTELKNLNSAIKSYESAFKINPDADYLLGRLIAAKNDLCNWNFFEENLAKLKNNAEKGKKSAAPFYLLNNCDLPELQKKFTEKFVKEEYPKENIIEPLNKRKPNKKIRLGYYSADFCNHPVSHLIANLFEFHDKSKFEIIAFSFSPERDDEMSKRISNAFDQFIIVNSKTEKEISLLSRKLEIDIAIDLMGFTKNNKFNIFVNRCAPIQINYLGYPGTSGSDCIDYIIGDKIVIPKQSQKTFSEKIIYLPNSYMVNDPTKKISNKIITRKEFGLPKNSFVFCCFCKNYKITPNIFNIWMKLLNKVSGSVLWLFEENSIAAKNLRLEASKRGVDEKRIIFAKRLSSLAEHFARHKLADLFLDTFPYTAQTTCSDALWAGLPVLTRVGESFASRVSGSLLNAIDLDELITNTDEKYENIAIKLATNQNYMNKVKNKLEKNRLSKPLFNIKLYTKHIESAYKTTYERYNNNLPIDNIEVS